MERNEKNSSTIASDFQTTSETTSESPQSGTSPLKGALVHISQAKLLLRRARAESIKCDQRERLNRTLDQISESIKWLDGGGPKDADLISAGALL